MESIDKFFRKCQTCSRKVAKNTLVCGFCQEIINKGREIYYNEIINKMNLEISNLKFELQQKSNDSMLEKELKKCHTNIELLIRKNEGLERTISELKSKINSFEPD